jgi:hypothetical protein
MEQLLEHFKLQPAKLAFASFVRNLQKVAVVVVRDG